MATKAGRRGTADGCADLKPRDKQLQSESQGFETGRPRNEFAMQTPVMELSLLPIGEASLRKSREDGTNMLEMNRDNPDDRNRLDAPPPCAFHSSDTVFSFALGGATRHSYWSMAGRPAGHLSVH